MQTLRNSAWRHLLSAACIVSSLVSPMAAAQEAAPGSTPRPQPSAEQLERRQIILNCADEGRTALRIATAYFEVNAQSKEATLEYAKQQGEKGEGLAGDLFPQVNAGLVTGAPRYATQRVLKCLETNNFPMDREVTVEMSDLCWARSDAIYQSMAQKQAGKSREEAEAALLARFANPVAFPPAYLREINALVFERVAAVPEANSAQVTFYLTCLVTQVRASLR